MYLAEHIINGRKRFVIRDSYYNPAVSCWQSRDLFDLGWKPSDYISYPGGNAFYVKESVTEELVRRGIAFNTTELEELFWPFLRKDIREKIEPFHGRGRRRYRKTEQGKEVPGQVQDFDRRRLYYLRCGAVDQRLIARLPRRFFGVLQQKSRDEIEQYIMQLEKILRPGEFKLYVYVSFDLQRYFRASTARLIPQALDQDALDRHFLAELCRLQDDELFWAGFAVSPGMHEYLVRYAVMFFDYEFDGESAWNAYLHNFINSHRFYRPPQPKSIDADSIEETFGMKAAELKAMSKNDLTRLFRQKAHALHPDKGGEHEAFVRLSEAYKELLRQKG